MDKQEPVAYINIEERMLEWVKPTRWETPTVVKMDKVPLYTALPQREWDSLTDKEMLSLYNQHIADTGMIGVFRAIEAKLKEKNT
jgi:hypothetical protein